jgi:toxin ParE1/3/4
LANVRRTATARRDLKEIWHYIAEDSKGAADKLLDQIEETLRLLSQFPLLGRSRSDLHIGIRSFTGG